MDINTAVQFSNLHLLPTRPILPPIVGKGQAAVGLFTKLLQTTTSLSHQKIKTQTKKKKTNFIHKLLNLTF